MKAGDEGNKTRAEEGREVKAVEGVARRGSETPSRRESVAVVLIRALDLVSLFSSVFFATFLYHSPALRLLPSPSSSSCPSFFFVSPSPLLLLPFDTIIV